MPPRNRVFGHRIKGSLRRINIWLVVTTVALAGWTGDALRMVFQMHATGWPGLGPVVAHFWYVLPMVVMLGILGRLRQLPKFLGLVRYSNDGTMIEQQGEVKLDDLTVASQHASAPYASRHGARGFRLQPGTSVYVVRAGSQILLLCYSRPISAAEVTAQAERVCGEVRPLELLAGLEPPVAALATSLLASPVRRSVLSFFHEHQHVAVESHDLAGRLERDPTMVVQTLDELVGLGLLARRTACDHTFYQVQRTPAVLALLDEVFDWRSQWLTHVHGLEQMIR